MSQHRPRKFRVSFYPGKIALRDLLLVVKVFLLLYMQELKNFLAKLSPNPCFKKKSSLQPKGMLCAA